MSMRPVSGPHTGANKHIASIMLIVIMALVPATLAGFYCFGWPAVNLFVITIASAVFFEFFCLRLQDKSPAILKDGSAILTGWLLAMTLPPWAPWWVGVTGAAIAIVLGKQVYGGLGQNVFNPAMLARVALLISFPVELTTWPNITPLFSAGAPGFVDSLSITFAGIPALDANTGATTLGYAKTELSLGHPLSEILKQLPEAAQAGLGVMRGSMGETSAVLILLGGLGLLFKKVITYHIPLSLLLTVAVFSGTFHWINPDVYLSPVMHLSSGALILGAFFIATDYVTSPNTVLGQLLFGFGCGVLVFLIRTFGAYPEGMGFAILLMNAATPLIDHYVKPRIYGRTRKGQPLES